MTRRARLGSRARLGVALALALSPAAVHAHLGHVVQRAERYLKLDVSGNQARLVVSLNLGPPETESVLGRADSNQDGEVDAGERDAYLAEWGRGLENELSVRVGGREIPIRFGEPFLQPIGPVRAVDGTVEMVGTFPIPAETDAPVRVDVADGMRVETFDRTDISFRVRDGARVTEVGLGLEGAEGGRSVPVDGVPAWAHDPNGRALSERVLCTRQRPAGRRAGAGGSR